MFCSSDRIVAFTILGAIALIGACDRNEEAAPQIVEVPVAVASSSASAAASAAPTVLTEPKRYGEEREHKAIAKVLNPDLPVTHEATADAVVVTKLAQGVEVARLVDVSEFSLVEYPDGTARKQGWVPSAGLQDDSDAGAGAPAVSASASVPAAAATTAAPTNAVTPPAASTVKPATSAKPATGTSAAPAATPAAASGAAPAASGRVRRGRLGR